MLLDIMSAPFLYSLAGQLPYPNECCFVLGLYHFGLAQWWFLDFEMESLPTDLEFWVRQAELAERYWERYKIAMEIREMAAETNCEKGNEGSKKPKCVQRLVPLLAISTRARTPEPELVDRPAEPQKPISLPEPIRCHKCQSFIQPTKDLYYRMDCSEDCDLILHKQCFQEGMEKQGFHKKREYKGTKCLTDACLGDVYEIMTFGLDNQETLFVKVNARPEKQPTKEEKKLKKKEAILRARRQSERQKGEDQDLEDGAVEEEPDLTASPEKPVPVESQAFAKQTWTAPLEDKYGAACQDKKKEGKPKKNKEFVTLPGATRSPPLEPDPVVYAPVEWRGVVPDMNTDVGLKWLLENISGEKREILASFDEPRTLQDTGAALFKIYEGIRCTASGVPFRKIRGAFVELFGAEALSVSDGGKARAWLNLTEWFIISKTAGKIMVKRNRKGTNELDAATAAMGELQIQPPVPMDDVKRPLGRIRPPDGLRKAPNAARIRSLSPNSDFFADALRDKYTPKYLRGDRRRVPALPADRDQRKKTRDALQKHIQDWNKHLADSEEVLKARTDRVTLDQSCPICRDFLGDTIKRSCERCGNTFHMKCIQDWLNTAKTGISSCPLCRHRWMDDLQFPALPRAH
ncbi:unnamed protein product, partial [Mesorhabditis spiculigera]